MVFGKHAVGRYCRVPVFSVVKMDRIFKVFLDITCTGVRPGLYNPVYSPKSITKHSELRPKLKGSN